MAARVLSKTCFVLSLAVAAHRRLFCSLRTADAFPVVTSRFGGENLDSRKYVCVRRLPLLWLNLFEEKVERKAPRLHQHLKVSWKTEIRS